MGKRKLEQAEPEQKAAESESEDQLGSDNDISDIPSESGSDEEGGSGSSGSASDSGDGDSSSSGPEVSDDGKEDSDDPDAFDKIDVNFEFFDPKESDFHGLKALLHTYLDGQQYDSSPLVDAIIQQVCPGPGRNALQFAGVYGHAGAVCLACQLAFSRLGRGSLPLPG
jgi:protein BCP1